MTSLALPPAVVQRDVFFRLFEGGSGCGSGCEVQHWGWMGCQTQAPLWDTCLISILDEWCRRRLIMPFEKWWQRKSVWKSEVHLHLGMKAALRHCVKALGLSFEAYCIYSMRITASRQSPKRSEKFISWALAILSDECDSCAVRADSRVCVCACARVCVCVQCISSGTVKTWLSNLEKVILPRSHTHANSSVKASVSWWIAQEAVAKHNYMLYF